VRYIGDERLGGELRLFLREQVPYVFVLDPTFNTDNRRVLRILDLIEQESLTGPAGALPTHWHFEVRAELLTREQARRFARLGASLQIGLQTSEPKTAALIGRDFDRRRFRSRIGLLNEEGAVFGLDLIYGLPGDSLAGFRRSLDFALSCYPNSLDLFRLAVLPGTALAEQAAYYGLQAQTKAPYEVIAAPEFSAGDLARAERLARGVDVFYNRGRAVAWFNQVLRPLGMRPSAFLAGFGDTLVQGEPSGNSDSREELLDSPEIEGVQLAYLEKVLRKARKDHLFPATADLVRYHGAWGRALAEGSPSEFTLNYRPRDILGALDLEAFTAAVKPEAGKFRLEPGKGGPRLIPR
jgi:hypothetical protein